MNCPNCGSQTSEDQQFCRECGAGLSEGEKRSFNPLVWGLVMVMLMLGGLLITMSGKLFDLRWLTFIGVFILIGGMFFMAALALWRQTRPRKREVRLSPQAESLERADTTNKLLPIGDNEYIPSVVEATTNLLKTPAPKHSSSLD